MPDSFPFALLASLTVCVAQASPLTNWLNALDLRKVRQDWGQARSNATTTVVPIVIAGEPITNGVGTHANSRLWLNLSGQAERFQARIGIPDTGTGDQASVEFIIAGDGRRLWESGVVRRGQPARPIDVDVRGVTNLLLLVTDAGDGITFDQAIWAEARFLGAAAPVAVDGPSEPRTILTPPAGPAPRINSPAVYGCRPGHPFVLRIPTTGTRPIEFAASGLPACLQLDTHNGILTGNAPERGEYTLELTAKNPHGFARRTLKIISGDQLALTPPMGWNHWYAHYDRVTDRLVREAADRLVASGMADVGYAYVSIDDCWMNAPKHADPLRVGPLRDAGGNLIPNKHFPDMKALTDYLHAKGLKAGIYTSPGPFTCAGFSGSWQHEAQDARRFADWGFDLLKYDWCSYDKIAAKDTDPEPLRLKKPYKLMGDLLRQQPRDLVLNLCQYGMGNVWEWGAEVGGHSWRTAGDLGFELHRIFEVALKNAEHRDFQKPGAWNDPDYIQIGHIGDARTTGQPRPCPLTPSEQYSFMSLWCLMASPLFYSGDMNSLDEFTLNILCNAELIEVNQDPLGQCARVVPLERGTFAMVKEMADGSKAVGLFNRGELPAQVVATWEQLGLTGRQRVRDLWRQRELGTQDDKLTAELPRHGGFVVRLWPVR